MSDVGSEGEFSAATGRSLENGSGADQRRYRAFQRSLIEPHCGPSVLEVGAGLGEFAEQLDGLERHVVTDVDPAAVASLAERFAERAEVETRVFDLAEGAIDLGKEPKPAQVHAEKRDTRRRRERPQDRVVATRRDHEIDGCSQSAFPEADRRAKPRPVPLRAARVAHGLGPSSRSP